MNGRLAGFSSLVLTLFVVFWTGGALAAQDNPAKAETTAGASEDTAKKTGPDASENVAKPEESADGDKDDNMAKIDEGEAVVNLAPESTSGEPDRETPEQAVYPGVTNRVLQGGGDGSPSYSLYYPVFNNAKADSDIQSFVDGQALEYEKDVKDAIPASGDKPASYDMWDMSGFFTLSRPNPEVVSVTFNIYSYSGGAHGALLIRSLNFDLGQSKRLAFEDLFANPEKALNIMSELSARKLRAELGDEADEEMIVAGTEANPENFANITLLADGALIEFQPYQVGPWAIGPQEIKLTLEELAEAEPNVRVWPNFKAPPPQAPKNEAEKAEDPASQS